MTSDDTAAPARAVDAPPRRRRPRAITVTGLVVLVAALAALAWSGWDLVLRPPVPPAAAAATVAQLRADWAAGRAGTPDPLATGAAVAVVRVPALDDREWPVLVGADPTTLRGGLGWYPGTAAPGGLGTFALAGHGGVSGPLAGLTRLVPGDQILVETATQRFTYTLTDPAVASVRASDTWVIQPVPGRPEVKPTQALLTLTSAHDLIGSGSRTVAFATLTATAAK